MNSPNHPPRAFTIGRPIGKGNTRPADVKRLRPRLSELDYLQSPIKAAPRYTNMLANAVERFQEDYGLQPDSVITPDGPTEQALNLAVATKRTNDPNTFDLAQKAFAHLNRKGFQFVRDRRDVDAMGVWRDSDGNRLSQNHVAGMLDALQSPNNTTLSSNGARLLKNTFGTDLTDKFHNPNFDSPTSTHINKINHAPKISAKAPKKPAPNAPISRLKSVHRRFRNTPAIQQIGAQPPKHPFVVGQQTPKNYDELVRSFRHHFIDEWRRKGLNQAADNLEHYVNGSGKPLILSRDQARAFKPIEEMEWRIQRHFEQKEFVGNTKGDKAFNKRLKNLKDGESLTYENHNKADISIGRSILQFLGDEEDFALSFGRTSLRGDAKFTAVRIGNKIHISGTVTYKLSDRYDFQEGQPGAKQAHQLEAHKGAKPFDINATWQQDFNGTVTVLGGVLSSQKIKWSD